VLHGKQHERALAKGAGASGRGTQQPTPRRSRCAAPAANPHASAVMTLMQGDQKTLNGEPGVVLPKNK